MTGTANALHSLALRALALPALSPAQSALLPSLLLCLYEFAFLFGYVQLIHLIHLLTCSKPALCRSDVKTDLRAVLAGTILSLIFNFVLIIYWGLTEHSTQALSLGRGAAAEAVSLSKAGAGVHELLHDAPCAVGMLGRQDRPQAGQLDTALPPCAHVCAAACPRGAKGCGGAHCHHCVSQAPRASSSRRPVVALSR